jgi:hypothetical protein
MLGRLTKPDHARRLALLAMTLIWQHACPAPYIAVPGYAQQENAGSPNSLAK